MEHEGKIILEKESIKLIDCNSCGIIHQHPQPTEKQLNAYYKKKYFKTKRSKDYFKQQIKQQ